MGPLFLRLAVVHAAEVLPQDVLAPAQHQFFVAEVEAVLEVQEAGQQADGQLGPPGVGATCTHQGLGGAKHVLGFEDFSGAIAVLKLLRHSGFDLFPRQAGCQYRQRIIQIDHGVNAAAEKVDCLHTKIPQKVSLLLTLLERNGAQDLDKKTSVYAGWRGFAGPTK